MESNLYITSYWQSLDLMQAGLKRDTADFVYERNYEMVAVEDEDGEIAYYEPKLTDGYSPRPRRDIDVFSTDVIPAWSMGRLWQIVGKLVQFYFDETDSPDDIIGTLVRLFVTHKDEYTS